MTPPRALGGRTARCRARHASVAPPPRSTSSVRCLEAPPLHPATTRRKGAACQRSGKGKAGSGPRGAGSAPLRRRRHQGRRADACRASVPETAPSAETAPPPPSWSPAREPRQASQAAAGHGGGRRWARRRREGRGAARVARAGATEQRVTKLSQVPDYIT
jgi:hypothetical protein